MNFNSKTVQHNLVYAIIFLVAVLLVTGSHYQWWPVGVVTVLAKEIGFAAIVSLFLVGTIETFSRERHRLAAEELLMKINKDLFLAIYKRYVPEKVFEEVEKCVMLCSVYRTCHELDYTIDDFPNGTTNELKNNYFQCTAQTNYKLANVLDQATQHDVMVIIERPIDSRFDGLCIFNELTIGGLALSREELAGCRSETESHFILRKKIDLQARQVIDISTKSTLLKKRTDSEIWCSRLPSDGLKLTVSTPSKGLLVKAFANHSEELKISLDNPVTKKWTLDFGIFPHQSIIFWWQPA